MTVANGTFVSPVADARYAAAALGSDMGSVLSRIYSGMDGWSVALTCFLGLVVYDQCQWIPSPRTCCFPHRRLP